MLDAWGRLAPNRSNGGLAAVLRTYSRRCLALSLPSSISAWILWYLIFAAVEFAAELVRKGESGQYLPLEGPLPQGIAIAIYLALPLAALLVFRLAFIAPYLLFRELAQSAARSKFPHSTIVRTREDSYCILVAVAGFNRDEITITEHEQVLFVAGQKAEAEPQSGEYPRGTFGHPFERRFSLGDNVEVSGATLEHGLLRIDVHEHLEPKRPRRIDVRPVRLAAQGSPTKVVDRPKVA
jgi:molecular chaperone IbpA